MFDCSAIRSILSLNQPFILILKNREEKIERVIVGIKTNKPKVNINLVDIFAPTLPFFLSIHVRKIFLNTLKQRHNNKIASIETIVIAIFGVVLKNGKEFVKARYVIIEARKDKHINKIVIFLFVDGFLNQIDIIVINFKKK